MKLAGFVGATQCRMASYAAMTSGTSHGQRPKRGSKYSAPLLVIAHLYFDVLHLINRKGKRPFDGSKWTIISSISFSLLKLKISSVSSHLNVILSFPSEKKNMSRFLAKANQPFDSISLSILSQKSTAVFSPALIPYFANTSAEFTSSSGSYLVFSK